MTLFEFILNHNHTFVDLIILNSPYYLKRTCIIIYAFCGLIHVYRDNTVKYNDSERKY